MMRELVVCLLPAWLVACTAPARAPFLAPTAVADPALTLEAEDLVPLRAERSTWMVVEGPDAGTTFTIGRDRGTDGWWRVHEGEERVLVVGEHGGGGRAMRSADALPDASRSAFEPPLGMCPALLRCGDRFESSAEMRVTRLESGRERDHGRATRRTEIVGRSTLTTPLGEVPAVEVRMDFDSRMRFARAQVRARRWVVPGVGPVAEEVEEEITVLGILPRISRRTIVRLPADPVHPAPGSAEADRTATP
jgi:hypothetical protein